MNFKPIFFASGIIAPLRAQRLELAEEGGNYLPRYSLFSALLFLGAFGFKKICSWIYSLGDSLGKKPLSFLKSLSQNPAENEGTKMVK